MLKTAITLSHKTLAATPKNNHNRTTKIDKLDLTKKHKTYFTAKTKLELVQIEKTLSLFPFLVVVGDKEVETGQLSVSIRLEGGVQKQEMGIDDLNIRILQEIDGKPYRKLPVPMLLSKRPRFL